MKSQKCACDVAAAWVDVTWTLMPYYQQTLFYVSLSQAIELQMAIYVAIKTQIMNHSHAHIVSVQILCVDRCRPPPLPSSVNVSQPGVIINSFEYDVARAPRLYQQFL